ncbi:hypothetical protein ABIE67_008411 [Streptomyces sp. V4I8]
MRACATPASYAGPGFAGREGGRGETGVATEEAAEVRGIGEPEMDGHSAGVPTGASQQAPGFEQPPLVDDFTHPLAGGVPGRAAEGANRTAEQPGIVRGPVQFPESQLQGIQEPCVRVSDTGGVYNQLRTWAADGAWERVFTALMAQADGDGRCRLLAVVLTGGQANDAPPSPR